MKQRPSRDEVFQLTPPSPPPTTNTQVDLERIRVAPNGKMYATDRSFGLPLILDLSLSPENVVIGQTGRSMGAGADGKDMAFGKGAHGKWCTLKFGPDFPDEEGCADADGIKMGESCKFRLKLRNWDREPVTAELGAVKFEAWKREKNGKSDYEIITHTDDELGLELYESDKFKSTYQGRLNIDYLSGPSYKWKFVARLKHLNTVLGETDWFDIEPGGVSAKHTLPTKSSIYVDKQHIGEYQTLQIEASDMSGNKIMENKEDADQKFKAKVLGGFASRNVEFEGNGKFNFTKVDALYALRMKSTVAGTYQIEITYDNEEIYGSPIAFTVAEGSIGAKTEVKFEDTKARVSKCDRTQGLLYNLSYPLTCSGNWQPRTIEKVEKKVRDGAAAGEYSAEPQTMLYNKLIVSPRDNYGNPIKLKEFFKEEGLPDTDSDFDLVNATRKHNLTSTLVKLDVVFMDNRGKNVKRTYRLEHSPIEVLVDELENDDGMNSLRYSVIVRPSKNDMVVNFAVPTKFSTIDPLNSSERVELANKKANILPVAPSLEVTILVKNQMGDYFPVTTLLHPGVTNVETRVGEVSGFLQS